MKPVVSWLCRLTAVVAFISAGTLSACAEDTTETRDTIIQFERAAMNREWAAYAQLEQAHQAEKKALALREGSFEDNKQRRVILLKSGATYLAAARSYGSALGNFDRASTNYAQIVRLYDKLGEMDNKSAAQDLVKKAKSEGTGAIRQAANICEAAAAVYNGEANDLARAAGATQAAAQWWEKLARR
jgi:hypothetical protein